MEDGMALLVNSFSFAFGTLLSSFFAAVACMQIEIEYYLFRNCNTFSYQLHQNTKSSILLIKKWERTTTLLGWDGFLDLFKWDNGSEVHSELSLLLLFLTSFPMSNCWRQLRKEVCFHIKWLSFVTTGGASDWCLDNCWLEVLKSLVLKFKVTTRIKFLNSVDKAQTYFARLWQLMTLIHDTRKITKQWGLEWNIWRSAHYFFLRLNLYLIMLQSWNHFGSAVFLENHI